MVLGHSIRATRTRHALVCLHTEDVPEAMLALLSKIWDCRLIEHVQASKSLSWPDQDHRFEHVFTKLRAMGLVEFEKVLMMDIDLLVMSNIDDLFALQAPAAMKRGMNDVGWAPKHGSTLDGRRFFRGPVPKDKYTWGQGTGINAGVMLWRPDQKVLDQMLEHIADDYHPSHIRGNGPEQDYLSRFWADAPWSQIDVTYNYQLHQMFFALHPDHVKTADRVAVLNDPNRIRIAHFSGEPGAKPWHRVLDADRFRELWPDRTKDGEYLKILAEEYHGYFLWVKRDEAAWQKQAEQRHWQGQYSEFSLGSDGEIYRLVTDDSQSDKEVGQSSASSTLSKGPDSSPPMPAAARLERVDLPEAATTGAMNMLNHCLTRWFDEFEAMQRSLGIDVAASLEAARPQSSGARASSEETAPEFTWKSTWFPAPAATAGVPTPLRGHSRSIATQVRMRYQSEGGWYHESAVVPPAGKAACDSAEDASESAALPTAWGKASVVCCAREGASFVVFHESGCRSETHFEDADFAEEGCSWRGVFAKVVGRASRPLLLGVDEDCDTSSLHIWASGVSAGSVVLIGIVGVQSGPLLQQILMALEPIGLPPGPVREGCLALAAAGVVGDATPWTSAHASEDAAYASVPVPISQSSES